MQQCYQAIVIKNDAVVEIRSMTFCCIKILLTFKLGEHRGGLENVVLVTSLNYASTYSEIFSDINIRLNMFI